MLNKDDIRELIKLVDESSITEFDYEYDGLKVSIQKKNEHIPAAQYVNPQPVAQQPNPAPQMNATGQAVDTNQQVVQPAEENQQQASDLHKIESPMVGTFYHAPAPDADPFVKEGDRINKSSVVCIVEAMKLMNEIEAEVDGQIVEILVEDGQLVEFGQPLFLVKA